MLKTAKVFLTILALWIINFAPLSAQHSDEVTSEKVETQTEKSFNAGKFVIDHVSDAYDWHITSFGDKHISIPLPIILYSKSPELHEGKNFHVFMSSKFNHQHDDYKGFRISHSEEFEGKIVELNAHGNEMGKPIDISITKTVAGIFASVVFLLWIFLSVARSAKQNKGRAPSGLQNLFEPIIIFIRDEIAKEAIGDKKYEKFMPFLLTLFFFILINNFM